MLAAASTKVMDALFGLIARNDAEWDRRELLGRSWRRDWGMRIFRHFLPIGQKLPAGQKNVRFDALGNHCVQSPRTGSAVTCRATGPW